jgi:hypothetical protein
MSNVTQRQLIEQIIALQQTQGKQQFKMSTDISTLMNDVSDQKANYETLKGYLENNSKTNSIGSVQLSSDNKKRLDKYDIKYKIVIGVFVILLFVTNFYDKIAGVFQKN